MSQHKQVSVTTPWLDTIEVDEGLSELLLAIWNNGIETLNSCQENRPGIAWIEFYDESAFKKFLNKVAVQPSNDEPEKWKTLYGRIEGFGSEDDWEYDIHPWNAGVIEKYTDEEVFLTFTGKNSFSISISVRFPVSDISELTALLKK